MTKQQVIDILEAYKPSGNIYNGYNSIEEKIDERICYLIDEIIGSIVILHDICKDGEGKYRDEYIYEILNKENEQ